MWYPNRACILYFTLKMQYNEGHEEDITWGVGEVISWFIYQDRKLQYSTQTAHAKKAENQAFELIFPLFYCQYSKTQNEIRR